MVLLLGQKNKAGSFSITLATDQGDIPISGTIDIQVDGVSPELDSIENALVTIMTPHHQVHEGDYYNISYKVAALGNGDDLDIIIVTSGSKEFHSAVTFTSGGDSDIFVYEDTTTQNPNDDGTPLTVPNLNRGSGNSATLVATHTPTILLLGTVLVDGSIGGGHGRQRKRRHREARDRANPGGQHEVPVPAHQPGGRQ